MVKNLLAMQETWVRPLGQEDALEEGMATQSSILAWRIPWTEEPGRLQSMGSQELDMTLKWSPSKKKTPRPYGEKLTLQESEESCNSDIHEKVRGDGIQSTDGGVTFDGNRNRTALFRLCLSLVSCPTRTTDDLLSSNS